MKFSFAKQCSHLALAAALFSACASRNQNSPSQDSFQYFGQSKGCFLLFNMTTGLFEKSIGEENCRVAYPACSTFKVPLAVMAFDSGVLADDQVRLKWDGKKDARVEVNRDHDARSWMKDSVVWFSQRLTPKMGARKFQKYLDQFNYGNKNFKAGLTTAWLVSPAQEGAGLRITAYEQVEFMRKLWTDHLPVSKRASTLARELTFLEVSPNGFQFSGKTGSNFYDADRKQALGWFIAHLQRGTDRYIAVTNFRDVAPSDEKGYGGMRAREITKKILAESNLW